MKTRKEGEPFLSDGLLVGDCPKLTNSERKENLEVAASAVSITEYVWAEDGQPPVIAWDDAFDEIVRERIEAVDRFTEKGICLLPWRVLESLPNKRKISDRLVWSQGPLPSCSMHGASHAAQFTALTEIAFGAPVVYEPVNPIYPFWIARNGNLSGGLNLFDAAREINRGGMFGITEVGDDNRRVEVERLNQAKEKARSRQAAVVFLEKKIAERIFQAAHAGFGVVFGSGTVFTGAREDENGVKVMSGRTFGGHAQAFGAWRQVRGKEYVWLQNSHGDIYGSSGEGEPASGAWVDRETVERLAEDMAQYGLPWVSIPEEPRRVKEEMMNKFSARFPEKWKF